MSIQHLFLDFDETLFNHVAFAEWMDGFFVEKYGITPASFKTGFGKHHNYLPDGMRLYLHAQHIKQATGKGWSYVSGEIEHECRQQNLDFCYPEVHKILMQLNGEYDDMRILTFGDGEYQRFKINSCGLLRSSNMGIHVVDEPKAIFLEREFPYEIGLLVDDKYPLNLPANWHHIWVSRGKTSDVQLVDKNGVIKISNLSQLPAVLKNIDAQH